MAVFKDKLQEEDASFIRFCKIVLGWDYFRLLREADVKTQHHSYFYMCVSVYVKKNKRVLIFVGFYFFFKNRKGRNKRVMMELLWV